MTAGAWTAACLLLSTLSSTAPGLPPDVSPVNSNRFEIPIRVVPERKADIKLLELWLSTDKGRTWSMSRPATPNDAAFPFVAQVDGEYWFTVVVVDQNNRREPPNIRTAPVNQKVLIDTLKPEIKVRAERQGDLVNVSWEIREEYPNLSTFKLEWRQADAVDAWTPVQAAAGLSGRASIRAPEAIVVRVGMEDAAQNKGEGEEKVAATSTVVTASATGPGPAPAIATGMGDPVVPPVSIAGARGPDKVAPLPDRGAVVPAPTVKPPEDNLLPPLPPAVGTEKKSDANASNVVAVSPPPVTTPPVTTPAGTPPSGGLPPVLPDAAAAAPKPAAPAAPSPDLQIVNTRRVTMEYEVTKYGPSGVGRVEVYMTRDDGVSWKKIPAEPQPLAAGQEGSQGVIRRTLAVDLAEDGIYGFHMVAVSGAGESNPPPRPNQMPEMRLKLDTRPPDVVLYKPVADTTNKDSLLIQWQATDDNLAGNPITIQWAEKPGGPWEHIGPAEMPNTGSYSWVVPHNIPFKVYLRVTARDAAGNVSVVETPQAYDIDLVKPEVHIKGLINHRGR